MAFDVFMQYLRRHVAVYYTKLKFVLTFAKLEGQFINRNDKLRAEQAILKRVIWKSTKKICELYVYLKPFD